MTVKKRTQRGFTLIETLVAVMILASSIAGPLSIASRSLSNSLVAKDQIIAFFLAQDAVEYVRFVRDSNRLKGADWLAGSGGSSAGIDLSPCATANGCYVDSTINNPATPTTCTSAGCAADATTPSLSYDSTNALFTYATGPGITASIFTRQILLTNISTTEQKLTVTVTWSDVGGVTRRVQVYENIFQWQ